MLRAFGYELLLVLAPPALYVFWHMVQGRRAGDPALWSQRRIMILIVASLLTMLVGLVLFGHFNLAPAGATYVPAHYDGNGVYIGPQFK